MNTKELLNIYLKENLKKEKIFKINFSVPRLKNILFEEECIDLDNYIKSNKEDNYFQNLLFNLIDNKGLKDSDVYNKAGIDRRLFSKIRNNIKYHPSKETVILLGLALELNESEIENLLNSASYSLPKNNKYDLIIRFCFINKIYNIMDVNNLLNEYKCKLLI